jgi:hypothetical protein
MRPNVYNFIDLYGPNLKIKGTFYPSTTPNAMLTKFQSWKLGWFLCFNINTFNGYATQSYRFMSPHSNTFSPSNPNIEQWAATAAASSAKIDYVIITAYTEYDWAMWDSKVAYNMSKMTIDTPYRSQATIPQFPNYSVRDSSYADKNILGRAIKAFKNVGIEPVIYFNVGGGQNCTGGGYDLNNIGTNPTFKVYFDAYSVYLALMIQELLQMYPDINYLWFDTDSNKPKAYNQLYYNAIKSINPSCQLIYNSYGNSSFTAYPYDIESSEYYAIVGSGDGSAIFQTSRINNGITYYVPHEIVTTTYASEQYYYIDSTYPWRPSFTPQVPISQSTTNAIYAKAKTNNCRCALAIAPNRSGNLDTSQTSLISNIVL